MNIAIIDDDKVFTQKLQPMIQSLFIEAHIDIYHNIDDKISFMKYNLVFLDVLFDQNESFSYGGMLLEQNHELILVYMSNMDHFVYQSFHQRTFFFMRKQYIEEEISHFYLKYQKEMNKENQKITFQIKNQSYELLQKDILYIQSKRNQITIYTEYTTYSVYTSLKQIDKQLDHKLFYRLNSFTIMNLSAIQTFDDKMVVLKNKEEIYFTRRSYKPFIDAYAQYRRELC